MNDSKVSMPNRERFLALCRGQRPGEVSVNDFFNRALVETPETWVEQGAPKEILFEPPKPKAANQDRSEVDSTDASLNPYNRYFQFEHINALYEIVSGMRDANLVQEVGKFFHYTPPIVPVFERQIIKEDGRHRVETTYGGQRIMVSKEFPWRMPQYLDHPVKDRTTWNEYKKRLDPFTPGRWPSDWNTYVEKANRADVPTCLGLPGFFCPLRGCMGLEGLLFTFYDDPKLIEEMMDQLLYLTIVILNRATRDLRIDMVVFGEDMAYKNGPLISPAMFKKFMIPRYKKVTDFLHSKGIDVIHVDSDGDIRELIPIWFDTCGINLFWPLEVAAGMDAVALRKRYGSNIILAGNIDKREFFKGQDAIKNEVMSKVPFLLETGGYFPSLDHSIPPDISLRNFRYFINLIREIAGMEKLTE